MTVAPPRRPQAREDLDALVREARSRQRRRQASIVGGFVLLAGVAFSAYSIAGSNSTSNGPFVRGRLSPAAAAACSGPVPPAVITPGGLGGARSLGNVLWISAGVYRVSYPTPVWMEAKTPVLMSRVVLRGWRCSDARLVRIWAPVLPRTSDHYAPGSPGGLAGRQPFKHVPVSTAALASTGKLTDTVCPGALISGIQPLHAKGGCTAGGYFMFSSPGKWVVQAQHGSRVVGAAVFDLHG